MILNALDKIQDGTGGLEIGMMQKSTEAKDFDMI